MNENDVRRIAREEAQRVLREWLASEQKSKDKHEHLQQRIEAEFWDDELRYGVGQ